jgi:tetratricopeptide (TPR) repeat protein
MGRWLHRRLEGYRLPKRLAGTQGEDGAVPERLTPIFRDRDELPAAGDLSERVRAALAVSRNLIVVCSPNSAASPWVAKEISTFRELHPDRPVFTAIIEGEPEQCFPPELREGGAEPLASDLRKEGDGRRLGILKLVAGLSGVGLDALVQRDAARRIRRVTYITTAAVAAMLVMALLTAVALNARAEAQRQRTEAEGLVEFMLTDLRDRLKGVGRLDVLTAVNQRALAYYQRQDLNRFPADSLERRARILHALGADDLDRGEDERALRLFHEAARTTGALLQERPEDPNRIYAHAQSEFWVGRVDFDRKNYASAKSAFERYKSLADRLISLNPQNPEWLQEAGYANGNLCTIALAPPEDIRSALTSCAAALKGMERAAKYLGDGSLREDLVNRHGWMADAWKASGDWRRARTERVVQERILKELLAEDPLNTSYQKSWIRMQIAMSDFYLRDPNPNVGLNKLYLASNMLNRLILLDPSNEQLRLRKRDLDKKVSALSSNRR